LLFFSAFAALALAAVAVVLIYTGAYPPEGTGSLGHVGTTIAGIIAAFLALILSLFTVMCFSKARSAALPRHSRPDNPSPPL
jgi:hypothetical protein